MAYPDRCWSAEWFAWRALIQFVQATAAVATVPASWTGITIQDWTHWTNPDDNNHLQSDPYEIGLLVIAAQDERADALGEILSQADEFISYFMNLMTISPSSFPKTTRVLYLASLIGHLVAMKLKAYFNRMRPSQLCPALLPPLAVPGHASFPSGHSTQAHLMALCINDVLAGTPNANPAANPPALGGGRRQMVG